MKKPVLAVRPYRHSKSHKWILNLRPWGKGRLFFKTRSEAERNAKQRKRIKEQMRKCSVCRVEPLGPRQRVCLRRQANRRHKRNQRYEKSLKQQNLRRVQPDFTREASSTVSASRISRCPARNVEREAVLTVGLGMSVGNGDLHAPTRPGYSTVEVTR